MINLLVNNDIHTTNMKLIDTKIDTKIDDIINLLKSDDSTINAINGYIIEIIRMYINYNCEITVEIIRPTSKVS